MSDVEISSEAEVSVSVGDAVTLRLPENASTGYVWSVDAGEGLSTEDDRMVPDAEAAPGAGGEHVIRLRARLAGTWEVLLRLERAWEPEPAEERRVVVTVE